MSLKTSAGFPAQRSESSSRSSSSSEGGDGRIGGPASSILPLLSSATAAASSSSALSPSSFVLPSSSASAKFQKVKPSAHLGKNWYEKPSDQTKSKVITANLLDLTAFLCTKGHDFMATRVVGEIWSTIAKVLGGGEEFSTPSSRRGDQTAKVVITAALNCLASIFANCGRGVESLLDAAGCLTIIWMREEGEVGDAAFEAVSIIARISGETIARGLKVVRNEGGLLGERARDLLLLAETSKEAEL